MPIAADYPFMNVLWTMILFFVWLAWIVMLIYVAADVFGRDDIGGWTKGLWCIFLVILPFVGLLAYVVSRHGQIGAPARPGRQTYAAPSNGTPPARDAAAEIERAARLRDEGVITAPEFEQLKAKSLAT